MRASIGIEFQCGWVRILSDQRNPIDKARNATNYQFKQQGLGTPLSDIRNPIYANVG
jgi:hypothetical protein